MCTNTEALEVFDLGEDGEAWFVVGTTTTEVATLVVIDHLRKQLGVTTDFAEMVDFVLTGCFVVKGDHWHWVGSEEEPYLRGADLGHVDRESIMGTYIGINPKLNVLDNWLSDFNSPPVVYRTLSLSYKD